MTEPAKTLDPAKLKVTELRQELTVRGLDPKGNKPDLVARLTSALAEDKDKDNKKEPEKEQVNNGKEHAAENNTTINKTNNDNKPTTIQDKIIAVDEKPSPQKVASSSLPPPPSSSLSSSSTDEPALKKSADDVKELTAIEKKKLRAERFGITFAATEQDKKLERAARFGLPTKPSNPTTKQTAITDSDKLQARKQRFATEQAQSQQKTPGSKITTAQRLGLPLRGGNFQTEGLVTTMDPGRIKARQERFGVGSASASVGTTKGEEELKRKRRAERFATNGAGEVTKRLRVDKPLEQQ